MYEPNCGSGPLAFLNNPYNTMIKGLVSSYKNLYLNLQQLGETDRLMMANDQRWSKLMMYQFTDSIVGPAYYYLLGSLLPSLTTALQFDAQEIGLTLGSPRDKLLFLLQLVLMVLGCVIMIYVILIPAEQTYREYRNTALFLPWKMISQNPLLSHHFKR